MQPHRRVAIQATAASLLIASAAVAAGEGRPAASPSGTIAYTVSGGNSAHLWQMDLASGSKRRLTRASQREQAPSWSPDGRRIAYLRGKHSQIAVLDVRSGSVRVLTTGRDVFDEDPAWSPDGRQIAWTRTTFGAGGQTVYSEIWVMRRRGAGARRLTHNRVGDFAPSWSPDGNLIAFTRYRGQNSDARGIWVMRRGGKGERRLIRNGSRSAWSPDGRRIAYGHVTRRRTGCGCRVTNLMVANARGRNRRLLVRNGGRPAWSPDGKWIVFQRARGDDTDLWIVRADGTGLRRLTAGSRTEFAAAWRPRR